MLNYPDMGPGWTRWPAWSGSWIVPWTRSPCIRGRGGGTRWYWRGGRGEIYLKLKMSSTLFLYRSLKLSYIRNIFVVLHQIYILICTRNIYLNLNVICCPTPVIYHLSFTWNIVLSLTWGIYFVLNHKQVLGMYRISGWPDIRLFLEAGIRLDIRQG